MPIPSIAKGGVCVCWPTLILTAYGKQRQEGEKVKAAWVTWFPPSHPSIHVIFIPVAPQLEIKGKPGEKSMSIISVNL